MPAAIADLDSIVAYGEDRWGLEAAASYANGLRQRTQELADHPRRFPVVEKIKPGLRSFAYRSHRIFYFVEDDIVLVVRILHQQADSRRHIR